MNKRKNENDDDLPYKKQIQEYCNEIIQQKNNVNGLPHKKQMQEYCDASIQQEYNKQLVLNIVNFMIKEVYQENIPTPESIAEKTRLNFSQASMNDFQMARNVIIKVMRMQSNTYNFYF